MLFLKGAYQVFLFQSHLTWILSKAINVIKCNRMAWEVLGQCKSRAREAKYLLISSKLSICILWRFCYSIKRWKKCFWKYIHKTISTYSSKFKLGKQPLKSGLPYLYAYSYHMHGLLHFLLKIGLVSHDLISKPTVFWMGM
jgi:hypothetical protein